MNTHFYKGTEYLKGISGQVVISEYDVVKLGGQQYFVHAVVTDLDQMIQFVYLEEI